MCMQAISASSPSHSKLFIFQKAGNSSFCFPEISLWNKQYK